MNLDELDKKIEEIYGSLTKEEVRKKFSKYGYKFEEKITVQEKLFSFKSKEFSTFEEGLFRIKNDNSYTESKNMKYQSEAA